MTGKSIIKNDYSDPSYHDNVYHWNRPNGTCAQCGAPLNAAKVGGYKLHDEAGCVPWALNATTAEIKAAIAHSKENIAALKKRLKRKLSK